MELSRGKRGTYFQSRVKARGTYYSQRIQENIDKKIVFLLRPIHALGLESVSPNTSLQLIAHLNQKSTLFRAMA